jgi:Zn finger protein HypA/HybF involved in hydrogenase expression
MVRGAAVLPHSWQKGLRIAVFAEGAAADDARAAGEGHPRSMHCMFCWTLWVNESSSVLEHRQQQQPQQQHHHQNQQLWTCPTSSSNSSDCSTSSDCHLQWQEQWGNLCRTTHATIPLGHFAGHKLSIVRWLRLQVLMWWVQLTLLPVY